MLKWREGEGEKEAWLEKSGGSRGSREGRNRGGEEKMAKQRLR